ncbi:MAG: tetratricopeptide repeat protein [Bacteroidota bacterium]
MKNLLLLLTSLLLIACEEQASSTSQAPETTKPQAPAPSQVAAYSLSGKAFYAPTPSAKLLEKLATRQKAYEAQPQDVEALIWYGRFLAYAGDYNAAIELYSKGIAQFPEDSRLYRHRGHRYISSRKFEAAIKDLTKAGQLIEGQENSMEPDGMPNAQNIPVSSRHGNIWYHLGLAHYLQQDMPKALAAYAQCLASTQNADNLVSSTHWLYMISRRMGEEKKAQQYLEAIHDSLEVIENTAYHKACLFYKGALPLDSLMTGAGATSGNDALHYAIGNWQRYNGQKEEAKATFEQLLANGQWNSFGYIAAEADLQALDN